jgi:hypothetical protein
MTPAQRCDEIIKMIDEVLGAQLSAEAHPGLGSALGPAPDPQFALTQFESPR